MTVCSSFIWSFLSTIMSYSTNSMKIIRWDFTLLDGWRINDSQKPVDTITNIESDMKNINQSQKKTKMINVNLDILLEEYNLDWDDIFLDVDERLLAIEGKLKKMSFSDKIILILYAELKSYRKVAKVLGFSHSTVMKRIKEIREGLC